MAVDDKLTTILIWTWKFQWHYWPMYCALADVQRRYHVRFILDEPPLPAAPVEPGAPRAGRGEVTDALIRAEALKHWREKQFCLALCEPDQAAHDWHEIPLLWRLPHWLLRPPGVAEPTPPPGKIRAYPPGSTSGDFARRLWRPEAFDTERLIHHQYVDKPGDRWALTFTPLHEFAGPDANRFTLVERYTGITQLASALIFPPRDQLARLSQQWSPYLELRPCANQSRGARMPLYEAIITSLSEVLRDLDRTQGQDDKVALEVDRHWDGLQGWVEIRPWLSGQHKENRHRLVHCIAAYVRLACYIPYPAVNRVFGPLVARAVEDEGKRLLAGFPQAVRGHLGALLDTRRSWADLGFADRYRILRVPAEVEDRCWRFHTSPGRLPPPPGVRPQPPSTQCLITHLTHDIAPATEHDLEAHFSQFTVTLSDQSERRLSDFLDATAPRSHQEDTLDFSKAACGHEPLVDPTTPVAVPRPTPPRPCAVCRICGFGRAVAWHGAYLLQSAIDRANPDHAGPVVRVHVHPESSRRDFPTLLAWEDVEDFFAVFVQELRPLTPAPQNTPRCDILISCSDVNETFHPRLPERVLLAIRWNGSTEDGSTGGTATRDAAPVAATGLHTRGGTRQKLQRWATQQNQFGRPVRGVWLWRNTGFDPWRRVSGDQNQPDENVNSLFFVGGDSESAEWRRYCFAYVAYYDFSAAVREDMGN